MESENTLDGDGGKCNEEKRIFTSTMASSVPGHRFCAKAGNSFS